MASDTNLNIVLGQGHAIKKIFNVKKQNLELQQQFAAQHTEVKEKRKKEVISKFSSDNRVEEKKEHTKEDRKGSKASPKDIQAEDKMETGPEAEGALIDIKV